MPEITSKLPLEVADDEPIVRGICSHHHVSSKGKLKPEAYEAPDGTDEVSVMRSNWLGTDVCKQRAKKLENLEKRKIYRGLAVLSAQQIREAGADVVDSRKVYEGHADIKHGVIQERGVPLLPQEIDILRQRYKKLAALAEYYPDQSPETEIWKGVPIRYKGQL